jgi:phosphatidylglycerol lysyltransferase
MQTRSRTAVHGLAVMVWALGILNLWSALFVRPPSRLEALRERLPFEVIHGSRLLTVVVGFLLFFLAYGIWRHKRQAWRATVVVLGTSIGLHLAKGLAWREAAFSTAGLAILVAMQDRFRAASDAPTLRRGLAVLALSVLFALSYGTVGFYFLDREFHARFDVKSSLSETLHILVTFSAPPIPHTKHAEWFLASLYLVGVLTLAYGGVAALRPVVYRTSAWEAERARAAGIVRTHGRSSLARMTLFLDKMFYFPPGLDGFVSFTPIGDTAVALGDPIAPPEDVGQCIRSFGAWCEEMDWIPCYYQVMPDYLDQYQAAGLHVLKIGEEAIIDLAPFDMLGSAWKDLRNITNRLTRDGFRSWFQKPPIDDSLLRELRLVSDEWLHMMHGREKRFSLGWFDPDYLRECDIQLIVAPNGRIEAFANYYTEYELPIVAPDLMRRRADAEKGVMDLAFVAAAQHYREEGYAGLNLGLAPLSGVGEEAEAQLEERMVRFMYEHLNRFYSFKGVRAFKAKFHPRWEPRYLIYASRAALPRTALAVIRANNPGLLALR